MTRNTCVGLDLSGKGLRYAVLRRGGTSDRLLRLGHVEFAFDVGTALEQDHAVAERSSLARAVLDTIGSVDPDVVRVALHAPGCRTFFSRGEDDSDLLDRVRFEAELLGLCRPGDGSTVVADPALADRVGRRFHVSVMPAAVMKGLDGVVDGLACGDVKAVSGIRAAAEVFMRLRPGRRSDRVAAIGQVGHGMEVVVLQDRGWRFAVHLPDFDPIRPLLETAGESEVRTAVFYGADMDIEATARTLGASAIRYDPFRLVDHDPDALHAADPPARFVTALGATFL